MLTPGAGAVQERHTSEQSPGRKADKAEEQRGEWSKGQSRGGSEEEEEEVK